MNADTPRLSGHGPAPLRGQGSSTPRLHGHLASGIILLALIYIFNVVSPAAAKPCPACDLAIPDAAVICPSCLRSIGWPAVPGRSRPAKVVVRRGRDAFIRGPNDASPNRRSAANAGGQFRGPIGSWYTVTGLRYLVRFDIPEACLEAEIDPAAWTPDRATLVLRVVADGDAREDVPLVAYALARPFEEGIGTRGRNTRHERGCNWTMATGDLPWANAGGDYFYQPRAWGTLPRKGAAEIELDVTDILRTIFEAYHRTGKWEDFGLILMRDPEAPARCTFREIHSLENVPSPTGRVLSPELFLE